MDGYVAAIDLAYVQGVEKDNKAARQYFETAAHLVQTCCTELIIREIQRLL